MVPDAGTPIVPPNWDFGTLLFDVFDHDLFMDAHIGNSDVNLQEVVANIAPRAGESPATIRSQPLEIALHRRNDGAISGFIRVRVHFEPQGWTIDTDSDGLPTGIPLRCGKLCVTVESCTDLWDPKDMSEWIPIDSHYGRGVIASVLATTFYFGLGLIFFCNVEGWTVVDALYFSSATFTTIGYGDVAPKTTAGKLFCCIFMIFGITVSELLHRQFIFGILWPQY